MNHMIKAHMVNIFTFLSFLVFPWFIIYEYAEETNPDIFIRIFEICIYICIGPPAFVTQKIFSI